MKLLQVKQYNAEDMRRYHERCSAYKHTDGGFPQIAFVGFRLPNGEMRQRGWVYVSSDFACAYYGRNKQEAEANLARNEIPF